MISGCGYDRLDADSMSLKKSDIRANMDIGDLTSHYAGEPLTINDPIVIGGFVTANDVSNNFYRTFVIEDETGAVEIKVGTYHLHNRYALNRRVLVQCRGLTLGAENGVHQLGFATPSGDRYQTAYLGHEIIARRYLIEDELFANWQPRTIAIPDLDERMCGSLVRVEKLQLDADQGDTWAFTAPMTGGDPQTAYRQFLDPKGGSIAVLTSGYASFAGSPLPTQTVSITGILQYGPRGSGKSVYMLKLRDLRDVQ